MLLSFGEAEIRGHLCFLVQQAGLSKTAREEDGTNFGGVKVDQGRGSESPRTIIILCALAKLCWSFEPSSEDKKSWHSVAFLSQKKMSFTGISTSALPWQLNLISLPLCPGMKAEQEVPSGRRRSVVGILQGHLYYQAVLQSNTQMRGEQKTV